MQSSKVGEGERREEKGENSPDWGGVATECGWTSDLRRSMGCSCVSLSSVHGGGAEVSLRMSFGVCEECVRVVCEDCVREVCKE